MWLRFMKFPISLLSPKGFLSLNFTLLILLRYLWPILCLTEYSFAYLINHIDNKNNRMNIEASQILDNTKKPARLLRKLLLGEFSQKGEEIVSFLCWSLHIVMNIKSCISHRKYYVKIPLIYLLSTLLLDFQDYTKKMFPKVLPTQSLSIFESNVQPFTFDAQLEKAWESWVCIVVALFSNYKKMNHINKNPFWQPIEISEKEIILQLLY